MVRRIWYPAFEASSFWLKNLQSSQHSVGSDS